MEDAKKARTLAKGQFTRAEKKMVKLINSVNVSSAWPLEQQYGELKGRWHTVEAAHDQYVSLTPDGDVGGVEEAWLEEVSERFDELELKVSDKIETFRKRGESQKGGQSTSEGNGSTSGKHVDAGSSQRKSMLPNLVKIEKLKFPVFGGDIRKYPEFKSEFVKHLQPQCNEDQLAFVLKGYLSESVREEVSHCNDDYEAMWERLDQKYGNIRMLIYSILEQVKHLECSGTGSEEILKMIGIVEKAWRDLERLGETTELCNAQTISTIEQAMNEQMQNEWVREIARKSLNSTAKFEALLKFLADWRCRIEYMGCGIRASGENAHQGGSYHASGGPADRCWLHDSCDGDVHKIWNCRVFKGKSATERRTLTLLNKACERCLEQACTGAKDAEKCQRAFICSMPGCGGNHNRLLHVATGTVNHASGAAGDTMLPVQVL